MENVNNDVHPNVEEEESTDFDSYHGRLSNLFVLSQYARHVVTCMRKAYVRYAFFFVLMFLYSLYFLYYLYVLLIFYFCLLQFRPNLKIVNNEKKVENGEGGWLSHGLDRP